MSRGVKTGQTLFNMENKKYPQVKTPALFFWGICFILFLPIIILPPSFQPSDWTRATIFRIILVVLVSVLFFKYFYKKELSFSVPKWKILVSPENQAPAKTFNQAYLPFLTLAVFFITLILATIFSEDIRFSIFGSPARAGGLLNLLFFFVFAVFLALFMKDRDWEKLWKLNFLAGFFASLLAIIQYFHLFGSVFIAFQGGGTPSFLGNSTFLAIYMLFLIFLSFTLFTQEKNIKKKVFYAALFCLFIFTVLISGARATYLGILTGFFYFFFFFPKKFKTLKIAAAGLVLVVIIAAILANIYPQAAQKNNLAKIVVDRLSVKKVMTDLAGTRFSAWQVTLKEIKEKPILGWGPENFYIGFEKYYDPTIPGMDKIWWDRPHNVFLDIWASSGIFSLLFYITFWASLLWQLQRFKRQQGDSRNTYLAHGVQAMFIGYLIALFFNFDNFSTYLISFFFIGYAFYLISLRKPEESVFLPGKRLPAEKIILSAFLITAVLFLYFWGLKPLYLNEKIIYAQGLTNIKKCDDSVSLMENLWKNAGILKSYAGLRYADFLKKCAAIQPEKETDYAAKGARALKQSSIVQPKYTRTWLFMGGFVNVLAAKTSSSEGKNTLLKEAMGYFNKALMLSPKRQEIVLEMEKNRLIAEDYQAMKEIAYNCLEIDPNYGQCYWYLGIAEIFLGDQENGKKHIEEARKKSSVTLPYIQLGAAYISQKNYADAAEAYKLAIFYDENNANYHATLAFLYRQIGEYENAGREAVIVFQLQPENKEEVEEFIKSLLSLGVNDPSLHLSLAFVYKEIGEKEKSRQELLTAKSLCLQLVARYPEQAGYHFNLAVVHKELGEFEEAKKEASLAAKLDPKFQKEVSGFIQSLPKQYWEEYLKER